jgi:hypothetical protein
MSESSLFVHDDLYDAEKQVATFAYCCPIFITGTFGTALARDDDLIAPIGNSPTIRSGTLTFVSYQEAVYGITCRHVVEALEQSNAVNYEKWKGLLGQDASYPPQAQLHFYFPTGNRQIHINAIFHKAPGDAFTNSYPDVAVARIPGATFDAIGRSALPIERVGTSSIPASEHTCGIATGYPEQNRSSSTENPRLRTLGVATVVAIAPFERFSETQLRLFAELAVEPNADNLSGMSGGPVIWSNENGWGLAGIIKEGRDMKPKSNNGNVPIVDSHVIWVDGEPLTRTFLISLIESIPQVDQTIPDMSKQLIGPGLSCNA